MTDKKKRKRIFHVKKWAHSKTEVCSLVEETSPIEGYEEECLPLWEGGAQQKHDQDEASVNSQLSDAQKGELKKMLREFADVVSNKPGRMQLAVHHTGKARPVRLPPY